MLILSRNNGDTLKINDELSLEVLRADNGQVQLAINEDRFNPLNTEYYDLATALEQQIDLSEVAYG